MDQWFITMFPIKFATNCGGFHTTKAALLLMTFFVLIPLCMQKQLRVGSQVGAGDERRKGFNKIKDQMIKELIGILPNYILYYILGIYKI